MARTSLNAVFQLCGYCRWMSIVMNCATLFRIYGGFASSLGMLVIQPRSAVRKRTMISGEMCE